MILNAAGPANPWTPAPFDGFAARYPATHRTPPGALDRSALFADVWQRDAPVLPREIAVVLTPGLFAEWLPQCFREARAAFAADGRRVLKARTRTALGIQAQAAALAVEILRWLAPRERFLWCAHSKGGIDALRALHADERLRARCVALVLVQPPVGRSWLIDAWTAAGASWHDRLRGTLLRGRWCRDGVRDISSARDPAIGAWLATLVPPVPTLHAVSWSVRATSWVDSYHRELDRLRPGHAHDGQFYLDAQRLPAVPVVGLAHLDHAQPVLGGYGLDAGRLWQALAACAWHEAR